MNTSTPLTCREMEVPQLIARGCTDIQAGDRLHRTLIAELAGAGCFRPATLRSSSI